MRGEEKMKGVVTKKDLWQVTKIFGLIKAIQLLFSTQKVALQILMG